MAEGLDVKMPAYENKKRRETHTFLHEFQRKVKTAVLILNCTQESQ